MRARSSGSLIQGNTFARCDGEDEFIGPDGIRTKLEPGPAEVIKRGPFNFTLKLGPVRLEYVNTKSWVKITQRAESERELAVDARFNLSKPGQIVTMQQRNEAWDVITGSHTVFATSKTFDGCGHLTDAERVAAFGIPDAASDTQIKLTADGRIQIAAVRRELAVDFHVVGQPIPVTAVTSPQAMIAPLRVSQIITSP